MRRKAPETQGPGDGDQGFHYPLLILPSPTWPWTHLSGASPTPCFKRLERWGDTSSQNLAACQVFSPSVTPKSETVFRKAS
jgi:hypothetical protein